METFRRPRSLALILVLLTLAAFLPFTRHPFVMFDDSLLITKNPFVQRLDFLSLFHIFTSYDPELYIPFTLLSYQITYVLFGLWPLAYNLGNLLLHTTSVVLLFWILLLLTKRKGMAFAVAALFAIHPIQTEAVLWASSRKDLLSGTFFFCTILFYMFFIRTSDRKWNYWSIAAFAAGLLSKVSIITLPLVLVLVDRAEGRPLNGKTVIKEKMPYYALCVIFFLIALVGKMQNLESSPPVQTFLLAARSSIFYIQKILVPMGLTVVYPQLDPVSAVSPIFMVSIIAVIIAIVVALLSRKRFPELTFGLVFYGLLLLPNSANFFKNSFLFFASDRYVYLASIGIFFVIVVIADRVLRPLRNATKIEAGLLLIVLLALLPLTHLQSKTWANSISLFQRVVDLYPGSALAQNSLGAAQMKERKVDEAVPHFIEAVKLDPGLMQAHLNLGNIAKEKGDMETAEREYRLALKSVDDKPELKLDQVAPYYYLGEILESMGKNDESLKMYQRAVEKAPGQAEPLYNLALQYHKRGQSEEAARLYRQAIGFSPLYVAAHYHLAAILSEQGLLPEAADHLRRVLKLAPGGYEKAEEHLKKIEEILARGIRN